MAEILTEEEIQDKVQLMEQFAVGLLDAFQKQSQSHEETRDTVALLSKKLMELDGNNNSLQELIEQIAQEGFSAEGGSPGAAGTVDEEQVLSIVETFFYEKIDFKKVFKGHTAKIFQEVEKRFMDKYPIEKGKKSSKVIKIVAISVGITLLSVFGFWGVFENVKEKPYYELVIPEGGKVFWREPTEDQPRVIVLGKGGLTIPLSHLKNGKYLFYNYLPNGDMTKDAQGKPVAYFIYENAVLNNQVKAIKLGLPKD